MLNKIKNIFVNGLIAFLPLAVTVYILIAGVTLVENFLGETLRQLLPYGYYLPGYGFIATVLMIFIFGLLVNNLITATLIKSFQKKMTEVPIVKAVYSPLRDLIHLFTKTSSDNAPQKVVLVKVSETITVLGLVTREDFDDLEFKNLIPQDKIAVLVLMSYGLGGYTLLCNKTDVTPVDISVEKAMSLAVTGWIKTDTNNFKGK